MFLDIRRTGSSNKTQRSKKEKFLNVRLEVSSNKSYMAIF
jgi:hypothetical protein